MSSGLASLAGYGSESDDDKDVAPVATSSSSHDATSSTIPNPANRPSSSKLGSLLPPPRSGLTSQLPPPSTSASLTALPRRSGLSLPPPSSSAASKRKVIKVDSFQSTRDQYDGNGSDEKSGPRSDSKKLKIGSGTGTSSKHSLFGMLPAPKRKDDEILAERKKEAEARKAAKALQESDAPALTEAPLRINEGFLHQASSADELDADSASSSQPKVKNNDAFRAMLGLKTAAQPSIVSPVSAPNTGQYTSIQQPSSSKPPHKAIKASPVVTDSVIASSRRVEAAAPVDFFSLGTGRASNSAASTSQAPSLSISSAPTISDPDVVSPSQAKATQDEVAAYPGWQLDPDGSWIPVTPEAQAQLLAYQQSLDPVSHGSPSIPSHKGKSNLDGTRDLLAAGLTPQDIRAFDASTAAREAYQNAGDDADSDKYAAAAEFAAGNRDIQQRKPGTLRGLKKGQLSSLVSLAGENRGQLEEKWKRGREARVRGANQYGF